MATTDLRSKETAPNGVDRRNDNSPYVDTSVYASAATSGPAAHYQPSPASASPHRKFADPTPLGLSAFALTTFVLSLINLRTRGVSTPSLVVALAFGYGGLVQLLAGMWSVCPERFLGALRSGGGGGGGGGPCQQSHFYSRSGVLV